ncbi:glyoxalase [Erysipelothrix larvae]|uniref:Glyoxalase n=1 Tax=Erysipelothrix larvae TaxID=1514105 RepID=A0A109UGM6_9FIRM|nr:VOC family protein [Erysipelothrix larvae]AMC92853.1 glyoxalase [Erysipelothrix larvae]
MKYKGTMLVVKDIEASKCFYTEVLGLRVISDFIENVTFTGGVSVQTEASWMQFTGCDESFFQYQGNVMEVYYETEDFDGFVSRAKDLKVAFIGNESMMPWGQKVVRFYDPDKHIIEVGEALKEMVKRYAQEGLSVDAIVEKTMMKKGIVERFLKG